MNDERKIIHQRLTTVQDAIQRLQNVLFALGNTDIRENPKRYQELSMDVALRSERITCQLRNLVYATENDKRGNYLNQAAGAQHISICQQQRILTITLPGLLPKRKVHTNAAFLHEPLNFALQEYVTKQSLPLYRDCVVCFSQTYDRNLSSRRVRDYDNLELKQILDTIAAYVLYDDSGLFCDSYHTTEFGCSDLTTIYIMEKDVFPEWVKQRKNSIQTISEIS